MVAGISQQDSGDIREALGRLNGTLDGLTRMVQRHEDTIQQHANELAEARGVAKNSRALAFGVPTSIAAIVETLRWFVHGGGHGQ